MKVLDILMKNKKKVIVVLIALITISIGVFIYNKNNSLYNKVIRFHVLANSDTNIDQSVKIKVKDEVVKFVQPLLEKSESLNESKIILNENKEDIIKLANKILEENGQVYTAKAEIEKVDFPVKSYGDIVFPSGEYDAFRIILGEGEGKNWWCVMFPPLCFVDVKNAIADEKMKAELEKVLTKSEMERVMQSKPNEEPKLKFKSLEIIEKILK